jgi:hypothetical protein
MLDKAIEKLNDEVNRNKNNPNIKVVWEFLRKQLNMNNGASEKVLQEGKTIKGSIDEMEKVAKTKAVGGCGMLTDQEGFEIVLKYFDIKYTPIASIPIPIEVAKDPVAPIAPNKKPSVEFNVELDF